MSALKRSRHIVKEGYLHVEHRQHDSPEQVEWNQLYCVVEEHVLSMYEGNPWINGSNIVTDYFKLCIGTEVRVSAVRNRIQRDERFFFEVATGTDLIELCASNRKVGEEWLKALKDAVQEIKATAAKATRPFKGWLKLGRRAAPVKPSRKPIKSRRQHVSLGSLPLEDVFVVVEKGGLVVYDFVPSHFAPKLYQAELIVHLSVKAKLKQFSVATKSGLIKMNHLFTIDGLKEELIFAAVSELDRQLWLNALDIEIIYLRYPKLTLDEVKVVQWLEKLNLEGYARQFIGQGFYSLDEVVEASDAKIEQAMANCDMSEMERSIMKNELEAVRPIKPARKVTKEPSMILPPPPTREYVKDSLVGQRIVGRYPLSISYRNASTHQKRKSTRLFTWGTSELMGIVDGAKLPRKIKQPQQVKSMIGRNQPDAMFAGEKSMACITRHGQLYTWGKGSLGINHDVKNVKETPYPVRSLNHIKIVTASCGLDHMGCISEGGDLYTWGIGKRGQLGLGEDLLKVAQPMMVSGIGSTYNDDCVSLSCGARHTVVNTNDGFVYVMGEGKYGKLGLGDVDYNAYTPTKVEEVSDCVIAQVAAAYNFTLAISLDGSIFLWGRITKDSPMYDLPIEIPNFGMRQVRQLESNGQIAAMLVASLDDKSSSVYTMGEMADPMENYILGHEKNTPEAMPAKVENLEGHNVTQISCGKTHMGAICKDGRLLLWGKGSRGQLGDGSYDNAFVPHEPYYIVGYAYKWVCCGNRVTGAILEDNDEDNSAAESAGEVIVPSQFRRQESLGHYDMDPNDFEKEDADIAYLLRQLSASNVSK